MRWSRKAEPEVPAAVLLIVAGSGSYGGAQCSSFLLQLHGVTWDMAKRPAKADCDPHVSSSSSLGCSMTSMTHTQTGYMPEATYCIIHQNGLLTRLCCFSYPCSLAMLAVQPWQIQFVPCSAVNCCVCQCLLTQQWYSCASSTSRQLRPSAGWPNHVVSQSWHLQIGGWSHDSQG